MNIKLISFSGLLFMIYILVEMFDETDKLIALNQFVIFSVGSGGFGGKKISEQQRQTLPTPQRKADQICRETTTIDQAALYRLTGDENPLHIDPSFAAAAGMIKSFMYLEIMQYFQKAFHVQFYMVYVHLVMLLDMFCIHMLMMIQLYLKRLK
jgi:hypothetical protein